MSDRIDLKDGVPYVLAAGLGAHFWTVTVTEHQRQSLMFHRLDPAGQRLALAVLVRHPTGTVLLNDIRLYRQSRTRQGLGTALLGTLLLALPRLGVQRVEGYTTPRDRRMNPKLQGWYQRHGFTWNPEVLHADRTLPMWWEAPVKAAGERS